MVEGGGKRSRRQCLQLQLTVIVIRNALFSGHGAVVWCRSLPNGNCNCLALALSPHQTKCLEVGLIPPLTPRRGSGCGPGGAAAVAAGKRCSLGGRDQGFALRSVPCEFVMKMGMQGASAWR